MKLISRHHIFSEITPEIGKNFLRNFQILVCFYDFKKSSTSILTNLAR